MAGYGRTLLSAPPCVSFQGMKIGRQAPTILLSPAIYASAKEAFSRPMTGHTPQKLPLYSAISCIIALRSAELPPHTQGYDTTAVPNCQAFFQNNLQSFASKFSHNSDFSGRTPIRPQRTHREKSPFPSSRFCSIIRKKYLLNNRPTKRSLTKEPFLNITRRGKCVCVTYIIRRLLCLIPSPPGFSGKRIGCG